MLRNGATIAALTLLAGSALAGPVNPPAGPVGSTEMTLNFKTLAQVEPRIAIGPETTPGDADAQFKITSSGSYYLPFGFSVSAGRALLEIAASNVTVDFGGMRVAGQAGSIDGVFTGAGLSNIVLLNGNFVNFGGDGVDAAGASAVRIENFRVRSSGGSGLRLGTDAVVDRCEIAQNASHNVVVGERSTVRDTQANLSTGGDGVRISGDGCRVERVTAANNGQYGVNVSSGAGAMIVDCVVRENGSSGVYLGVDGVLERCSVMNNAQIGVSANTNSSIAHSNIAHNGSNGVSIAAFGRVTGNVIHKNLGDGVYIFGAQAGANGKVLVADNRITYNGDADGEFGIKAAAGVNSGRIDGNTLIENKGGIKISGFGFSVLRNESGPNYGPAFDIDFDDNDVAPVTTHYNSATSPWANIDGGWYIIVNP